MSVKVELHLEGDIYPIKFFRTGFQQGMNMDGFPSSKIRQKGIQLSLDMVRAEIFEEWAYHNHRKLDFEIHLIPNILGSGRTRVFKCYEGFLHEFTTDYSAHSKEQTTYHLNIMCGRMEFSWSTCVYKENWAQEPVEAAVPTIIEEPEKKTTSYYLTDTDGNQIDDYDVNDIIILNIESQNRIGDSVTINLDDAEYDFEYQGNVLPNDTIQNYIIGNDLEQITLKVVKQKNTSA